MECAVKLQGISGEKQGIKAIDLKVGNVLIWNFGYKSEIVKLETSKTGKSIKIFEKSYSDGIIRERKTTINRLFVVE
jgi:translation elongation factor P/translation initiation factor 5A